MVTEYLGQLSGPENPFNAPEKGREIAGELYERGVDVLFAVAAASNKGIFEAARQARQLAIGVDADQDHLMPGTILTSVMKRQDTAIVFLIGEVLGGRLENRNYTMGLEEGGISLSPMTYTGEMVGKLRQRRIKVLAHKIVQGSILVPTTMDSR